MTLLSVVDVPVSSLCSLWNWQASILGGLGMHYRLGMGPPDKWAKFAKEPVEHWSLSTIVGELQNRRIHERTIAYLESHDQVRTRRGSLDYRKALIFSSNGMQALVGSVTFSFGLMGASMYHGMKRENRPESVHRGVGIHKMARLLTLCLGGDGWLSFMGNEFGHPDWIDFPRPENTNSYFHARRQWSLRDNTDLLYSSLWEFDKAIMNLEEELGVMRQGHTRVVQVNEASRVVVLEKGETLFAFNFAPNTPYYDYKVGTTWGGKYTLILNSDSYKYGGYDSMPEDHLKERYTSAFGWDGGDHSILLTIPCCSVVAYRLTESSVDGEDYSYYGQHGTEDDGYNADAFW